MNSDKQHDFRIDNYTLGGRYFIVAFTTIVVLILMFWLTGKLDQQFDRAEQAQFELRLAELRAAVLLMESSSVAKNDLPSLGQFDGANPMDWIKNTPGHYLGEMSLADAGNQPGNWVYDPFLKVIAYLPRGEKGQKEASHWLRYKVVALLSKDKKELNKPTVNTFQSLELKKLSN